MCLAPALPAAAMTAAEAFEDGNRLFRDDLYWAALLRYRQAGEAGMDSALLHFNTGVAHYWAQQHIRARESLLEASRSAGLRVISHYNLGLNAYAAGDIDDALNWFRQASDQEENEKIRKLAMIAISRLQAEKKAEDPILVRVEKRREEKKFANFDLEGRVGFGSDDNVFRAPSQAYLDFSDPALPLVTPEEMSGTFLPIDFLTKYSVNSLENESFFGQYRIAGRYYQDKELEDANEFSHELRFGSEFNRRAENRLSRVYSAFTIAQHDETYYDPDDGSPRTIAGELIDDRLNYVRYGPELAVLQGFERFSFGLRMKGQLWDYDETGRVPEYDHEYFRFGGHAQYKFGPTSMLRLTVDKYSRRYSDRPSFDLNGQQLITNPSLRYDYLEFGMLARQRITRNMWFGLGYKNTDRMDRYLGYNNYNRDTYSFEYHWTPGNRFDLDLTGNYRIYDFPNTFAFHNPVAGPKTLETAEGELAVTYRITKNLSIVAEAEYRETASTDTRIAYDRIWYSIGVVWQQ
ncbi:MAG: hypothetical protein OEM76_06510 [Gammaproteobacteria bacterium]|nr:hypothetical protein [Gammaproteobacteria bacterium]